MKLNLPVRLRSSLLACVCSMAAVGTTLSTGALILTALSGHAKAEDLTQISTKLNDWGNYVLDAGVEYDLSSYVWKTTPYNSNINETGRLYLEGHNVIFTLDEGAVKVHSFMTQVSTVGSFEKKGNGLMELAAIEGSPERAVISGGTFKVSGTAGSKGFVSGDVTVKNGATLQLSATDSLGYSDGNYTDSLTLEAGAKLLVDVHQTLTTNISLENGASIDGGGDLKFFGGTITTTGTNTISTTLKAAWDVNLNTSGADDVLTVTKAIEKDGGDKLRKKGAGTLVLADNAKVAVGIDVYVESGTLKAAVGGDRGFAAESVHVSAGATLQLAHEDALGYGGSLGKDYTNSVNLLGSAEVNGEGGSTIKLATLQVDDKTTLTTNINLQGNAAITGTGDLRAFGGIITATGTNNTISTTLLTRQDMQVKVEKDGELTISGKIDAASNHGNSDYTSKNFIKSGEGTLVLASASKVTGDVIIQVDGGKVNVGETSDNAYLLKGTTLELTASTHIGAEDGSSTKTISLGLGENTIIGNGAAIFNDVVGEGNLTLTKSANIYADLDFSGDLTISDGSYNLGYSGDYGVTPHIKNTGDVTIAKGASATLSYHGDGAAATIENGGALNVNGSLTVDKGKVSSASVRVSGAESLLTILKGGVLDAPTVVDSGASMVWEDGGSVNGSLTVSGKLTLRGTDVQKDVALNGGVIDMGHTTLDGTLTLQGGNNVIQGDSSSGSVLKGNVTGSSEAGLELHGKQTLKVQGRIEHQGDLSLTGDVRLESEAANTGDVNISSSSLEGPETSVVLESNASLSNSGSVNVQDGSLTISEGASVNSSVHAGSAATIAEGATYSGVTVRNDSLTGGSLSDAEVAVSADFTISGVMSTDSTFMVNGGGLTIENGSNFSGSKLAIGKNGSLILDSGALVLTGEHSLEMNADAAVSYTDGEEYAYLTSNQIQLLALGEGSNANFVLTLQLAQIDSIADIMGENEGVKGVVITFDIPSSVSTYGVAPADVYSGLTFSLSQESQQAFTALGYSVGGAVSNGSGLVLSVASSETDSTVPEPTTTALSLLALAALAARRRRQQG